jgi:CheY-like chemotaxis protein
MTESKKIMVIDDDPDFLSYVQIVLVANGYQVCTASSASDGLQKMRGDPPALVIVDVMMSYVLDGWNVRREMLSDAQLRDIPVLMVSAIVSDDEDALFPSDADGRADAFMSKPVEPAALLARVSELTQEP